MVIKMGEAGRALMGVMPFRYYYESDDKGTDAGEDPQDAAGVPVECLHAGVS